MEKRPGSGQRWVIGVLAPGRGQLDGGRLGGGQRDEGHAVRVQRRGRLGDKGEADTSLDEGEHRVHLADVLHVPGPDPGADGHPEHQLVEVPCLHWRVHDQVAAVQAAKAKVSLGLAPKRDRAFERAEGARAVGASGAIAP